MKKYLVLLLLVPLLSACSSYIVHPPKGEDTFTLSYITTGGNKHEIVMQTFDEEIRDDYWDFDVIYDLEDGRQVYAEVHIDKTSFEEYAWIVVHLPKSQAPNLSENTNIECSGTHVIHPPEGELEFSLEYVALDSGTFIVKFSAHDGNYQYSPKYLYVEYDQNNEEIEYGEVDCTDGEVLLHLHTNREPVE